MISKDIFYLLILQLDPKDTKTFSALRLTCKNSLKACRLHSENVKRNYMNSPLYIWYQVLDGWGSCYKGTWRATSYKPEQNEIDPLHNIDGNVFITKRSEFP